jgi:hypothetical protein
MSGMNDTTLKEFMAALLQSHHKLRTWYITIIT